MLCKEETGFGNLISGRLERSEIEGQGGKKGLWASAVRPNNQSKKGSYGISGVMSSVRTINHDSILSIWGGGRYTELSKRNVVC